MKIKNKKKIAPSNTKPSSLRKDDTITNLKENEDFYIENGFYVFTENYLKKRGYCCKNGCRHCPYKT